MGCDIHTHTEKKVDGLWVTVDIPPVWNWRSYELFGFLAGVRNYSVVPMIADPRGLPNDASAAIADDYESWSGDAHTASWLTVDELLAFDYDASMVDRRITRQTGPNSWDGGCTGTIDEGARTTFREFLGPAYFADIERMKAAGVERVVFWFDN